MALTVGSRLGRYNVTALIGEGGMGQVYRATDTQLGRDVALKILPDAFAEDPDRLARFQREAHVLASLNHPGIAAIYGIEKRDDTQALVLELVEGPTLADRIAKGPIPLDEALPIAKQIAEALEAAHEAGVIHRDLKPANIKVREDGIVKVLDFGLAKALDTTPEGDPSQSPTLTAAATQMGVILGTAAYMSPEQARGKSVDRRADIWAFGCVLFEMLAGQRAFRGEDVSLTLAAVLERQPDWRALPEELASMVRTYLRRSLEKDARRRVRDIGDMRLALEGVFDAADDALTDRPAWSRRSLAASVLAATLVGALVSGGAVWRFRQPTASAVTRLTVTTGEIVPRGLALSPDGRTLVFAGLDQSGAQQLYHRPLDRFEATLIPGTSGAFAPFFSPDGSEVGFADSEAVKRVSVSGGSPVTVAPLVDRFRGGSWSADGAIVFAVEGSGLWRVPAAGGSAVQVTTFADGETLHWAPEMVPDSPFVLFTARIDRETDRLMAQRLDNGDRFVLGDGEAGRLTPGGRLSFIRDGDLWTARFDARDPRLVGVQGPILEGVASRSRRAGQGSLFAIAGNTGTVAYVPFGATQNSLVWVDRSGRSTSLAESRMRGRFRSAHLGHRARARDGRCARRRFGSYRQPLGHRGRDSGRAFRYSDLRRSVGASSPPCV